MNQGDQYLLPSYYLAQACQDYINISLIKSSLHHMNPTLWFEKYQPCYLLLKLLSRKNSPSYTRS